MPTAAEVRTLHDDLVNAHTPETIDLTLLQYFTNRLLTAYSEDTGISLDRYKALSDSLIADRAESLGISPCQFLVAKSGLQRAGAVLEYIGTYPALETAPAPDLTPCCTILRWADSKIKAMAVLAVTHAVAATLLIRFASVTAYFDLLPHPIPI